MKPILSILIATRNRVSYCANAIETILMFEYQNFELVIQDNSDNLDLHDYIKKNVNDNRLVYNYTPPPFSSIDNFNAVIGLAQGEYLCLIGDDDGINPEIFRMAEWAKQNDVDSILPGLNVMFRWPDACTVLKGFENDNGEMSVSAITGKISVYNTSGLVEKLMNNGGQDYLNLHFPKLYHGVVRKKYMDEVKEQIGQYVGGLSPDIYIAVALSYYINKIIEIDYPLTIPGACIVPIIERHREFDKLEDAPHFRDRGEYHWSDQVPKFHSGSTIWADSALASLKDMKRFNQLKKFSVTYLTLHLLSRHQEHSSIILENYFNNMNATTNFSKRYYTGLLSLKKLLFDSNNFKVKAINKIRRIGKKISSSGRSGNYTQFSFKNVTNISTATTNLKTYLDDRSLSIENIIENLDRKYSATKNR